MNTFLFVFGLCLFQDVAAQDHMLRRKHCHVCNESLSPGATIQMNRIALHRDCLATYLSTNKNRPNPMQPSPVNAGNARRHAANHQPDSETTETKCCMVCRQSVRSGPYYAAGHQLFHRSCFAQSQKCERCSLPLFGVTQRFGHEEFHEHCVVKADVCADCGRPITGRFTLDAYGRKMCRFHDNQGMCHVCKFSGLAVQLEDGRYLCERCHRTAVYDLTTARALMTEVLSELNAMGLVIGRDMEFQLVKRNSAEPGKPLQMGLFTRTKTITTWADTGRQEIVERWSVRMLAGLPAEFFKGVLAHELTHAWQAQWATQPSKTLAEGFAELVSYLYHQSKGNTVWAELVARNQLEPYRSGFQQMRQMYLQMGAEALLAWVGQHDELPAPPLVVALSD